MRALIRHRAALLALFLCLLLAVAGGVWRFGYIQALDQLARRGEADLALAADRLTSQLQNYQQLAVLMAEHPSLLAMVYSTDPMIAKHGANLLLETADKTAALDLIYADANGTILATAKGTNLHSANLSATPHFARALNGALGTHHAIDPYFNERAFYFASPSFGADGKVVGVLTVVVDVQDVEENWRGNGPAVVFMDAENDVFITNRSELLYWRRPTGDVGLSPPDGPAPPFAAWHRAGHDLWQLDWGPYLPKQALHIVRDMPLINMHSEALFDTSPARRLATLQAATLTALVMVFGLILLQVLERRRVLAQANAELENRVTMRTRALSATNLALRREITEREEAEAALKKAQADLVQAGKLSALGQMSAGISHELNQPLQAIQTFAENGARFLERDNTDKAGDNLNRISQMATRMARIIKNMRAFARNENEPVGRVDLVAVISQAVELTGPRLREFNVTLDWQPDASGAVYASGGDVRLTQVFVNLINNAIDAMLAQPDRHITIAINNGKSLRVTVRDIGPGLEEPEKVFDPFYTTKATTNTSGAAQGMGLGLSISYGLVQSFGGNIKGSNASDNGAMFTVELNYWQEENSA